MKSNLNAQKAAPPRITSRQIRLLERLCNACGVSGDEGEVRAIVLEQIRPIADDIRVDALGNVLAVRRSKGTDVSNKPLRVMIAAHMDEVGVMITRDEGGGIFRFQTVGGVDGSSLAGKPVWIGRSHQPGVIGMNPIHLTSAIDRNRKIDPGDLRIDVSPDCAEKIKVGDRATFATAFSRLGPSLRAKALDDRIGVSSLIELFCHAPPNIELLAAFTVQEEVGLRGARVAAFALDPDLAIVLDCTPARDLPDSSGDKTDGNDDEDFHYNTRLGGGPAIYISDHATVSDPRLVRHFTRTGDALGIRYQLRQPGGGGTDAGAIHKQRLGIPSISVSVPGRYIHTGVSIARLQDWKDTLALVYFALEQLTPEILAVER